MLLCAGQASPNEILPIGNLRGDAEAVSAEVTGTASRSAEEGRRNLLASGMVSDVKVAQSGGPTVVTLRQNNLINRVVFEGNKKVEAQARVPHNGAI
ncbi:outer membrane protein assembly factor BamA, partial [Methylobacterium sp. J-026]|nr:outer membrane protein assembly factor BamA [Methylobacterium sp. J-026]